MNDQDDIRIFKVIGKVHIAITESKKYDEAVRNALHVLIDGKFCDDVVVWLQSQGKIRPFYWIGKYDLSAEERNAEDNGVGRCIQTGKRVISHDSDPDFQNWKTVPDAASSVCVPIFLNRDQSSGCIEVIKNQEKGRFTERESDVISILVSLIEMEINEHAVTVDLLKNREILLSCRDIKKAYQNGEIETKVLKGVSLSVYKGEFLCLLGESGCGKSTLLNIIGGLIRADSGSILFENEEIIGKSKDEYAEFRRKNLGYIFQAYNLIANLNALENIQIIAELVGDPMNAAEALRLVGLEKKSHNFPSELSGGQQQRVSIARALVKKPKLILADEPTAALDYETSIEVLSVFEDIVRDGTTLVMVTHNEEIAKMADRVIRFKGGLVYETIVNNHPLRASELAW